MGNTPDRRALREYRVDGSEWFAVDMLTAVEAIQEAAPQTTRRANYNMDRFAWRNKQRGKSKNSTRYTHLNESA